MNKEILRLQSVSLKVRENPILSNIFLTLLQGEVLGIIGKNGSGKSTIVQLIAGRRSDYTGKILFENREVSLSSWQKAADLGIMAVHQETYSVDFMSVAEHIFLMTPESEKRLLLNKRDMQEKTTKLLEKMEIWDIKSNSLMGNLSENQKKFVELAKALSREPKVLLLDDVDMSMDKQESEKYWEIVRRQKKEGISCIVTSHNLPMMRQFCNHIAVIRDGRITGCFDEKRFSEKKIVNLVLGTQKRISNLKPDKIFGTEILKVENVSIKHIKNLNFTLAEGEILGIAGTDEGIRKELGDLLYGQIKPKGGKIYLNQKEISIKNTIQAVRNGIGFMPEKTAEALLEKMSVKENIALFQLNTVRNIWGYLKPSLENFVVNKELREKGLTDFADEKVSEVSRGTKQRVLFTRWQEQKLKILVLNHPVNGMDIGEKVRFSNLILQYSKRGIAVLLITNDLEELVTLCHRVIILKNGIVQKELEAEELSELAVTRIQLDM